MRACGLIGWLVGVCVCGGMVSVDWFTRPQLGYINVGEKRPVATSLLFVLVCLLSLPFSHWGVLLCV